ncbi:MAG: RpoL/Rpb11 RNA polymerase subunit family protein [Nitrososphaeria archaeon]
MNSNHKNLVKEIDLGSIDMSIALALQSILIKHPNVSFAGVTPPHPLFGKISIKIMSKDIVPEKCLFEAATTFKKELSSLYDDIVSSLSKEVKGT